MAQQDDDSNNPAWGDDKRVSNFAANKALVKCLPFAVKQIVDGGGLTAQLFKKMDLEDYCKQKLLLPFACMNFIPQNIEISSKYFEKTFNKLYTTGQWFDDGDNTSMEPSDFPTIVQMMNFIGENCLTTDARNLTEDQMAEKQKEVDVLRRRCEERYVYGSETDKDDLDQKTQEVRKAFIAELDDVRTKRGIAKAAMDAYVLEANGFDDTFVSMRKDLQMWDERLRMGIEIMSQTGDDLKELFAQLKKKRDEMRSPMEKILQELALTTTCFPKNSLPVKSFINADNELAGWEETDDGINPMPVMVSSPDDPESIELQTGMTEQRKKAAEEKLESAKAERETIEAKNWPYRRKRREERRLDTEIYTLQKRIDRLAEMAITFDEMLKNAYQTELKVQAELKRLKAKQKEFAEMYKSLVEDTTGTYKPVWTVVGEGPKGAWRIEYEQKDNVSVEATDDTTVNSTDTKTSTSGTYGGFWGSVSVTAAVGKQTENSKSTGTQDQKSDRSRFYFEWHRSELLREDNWDECLTCLRSPMVYFDMTRDNLSDVKKMTPGYLNEKKGAKWLPHTIVFCQKIAVWDYSMASSLETSSTRDKETNSTAVDVNVDTMWGATVGVNRQNANTTENQRNQAKMKMNQEFRTVTIGNPMVAFLLLEHLPFFPIRTSKEQNLAGEIGPDYFPQPELRKKT